MPTSNVNDKTVLLFLFIVTPYCQRCLEVQQLGYVRSCQQSKH